MLIHICCVSDGKIHIFATTQRDVPCQKKSEVLSVNSTVLKLESGYSPFCCESRYKPVSKRTRAEFIKKLLSVTI